jgi:hypothetical protein
MEGAVRLQEWDVKLGNCQGNCRFPRCDAVLLYVVYFMTLSLYKYYMISIWRKLWMVAWDVTFSKTASLSTVSSRGTEECRGSDRCWTLGVLFGPTLIFVRVSLSWGRPRGRTVKGVGLVPLACWYCGFESQRGHGRLFWALCVVRYRGPREELITRPEESYRLWCVVACDLETSWMRKPWSTGGFCAKRKADSSGNAV